MFRKLLFISLTLTLAAGMFTCAMQWIYFPEKTILFRILN